MSIHKEMIQQNFSIVLIVLVLLALLSGVKQALALDATRYRPAAVTRVSSVPVGTITAWPVGSLPADGTWVDCDGRNGTPDLRGRFVRGVDATHPLGSYQADNNSLHSHTIKPHDHDVVGTAEGQVVTVASQGVSGNLSGTYVDKHLETVREEGYRNDKGVPMVASVGNTSLDLGEGVYQGNTNPAGNHNHPSSNGTIGVSGNHNHTFKVSLLHLYGHDTNQKPDKLYLENNKVKTTGGTYRAQSSNTSGTALPVSQVTDTAGDATDDGHPKNVSLRYIMKVR